MGWIILHRFVVHLAGGGEWEKYNGNCNSDRTVKT